ncbi:MAG: DUF5522 domain-containing protein [Acidimicrobiales bacterium]|jgi:hypothetical protein
MTTPEPDHPADRSLYEPDPARLPLDRPDRARILAAHAEAVERGDPFYLDPDSGLFVMTASYLLDRARCCHTGCRHCPYAG